MKTLLYNVGTLLWAVALIPYVVITCLIIDGTKRRSPREAGQ